MQSNYRNREKPFIAKNYLNRALNLEQSHAYKPDPRVYLDLGLVEFQLGDPAKAIVLTQQCLHAVNSSVTSDSKPKGGKNDSTSTNQVKIIEADRVRAISQYNLMTYRSAMKKWTQARRDGDDGIRLIRMALRKAESIILEKQIEHQKRRAAVGDLSEEDREESPVDPEVAVIKTLMEKLDRIAKKIIYKQRVIDTKAKEEESAEDSEPTLRLKSPQRNVFHTPNQSSMFVIRSNKHQSRKTSHSRPESGIKIKQFPIQENNTTNNESKLPDKPHFKGAYYLGGRPMTASGAKKSKHISLSNPQSGVLMNNCQLLDFRNRPFYFLDEFAQERDKSIKNRTNIGKVIKNSIVKIYGSPTSSYRKDPKPLTRSVNASPAHFRLG